MSGEINHGGLTLKKRKDFMKKKIVIAVVLLVLFAVGVIYAQATQPVFGGVGTSTLTARNPNRTGGNLSGSVCIFHTDADGRKGSTTVPFDLKAGASQTLFTIRGGTVDNYSLISCQVIESYF